MSDDLERHLRDALHGSELPAAPESLRDALGAMPEHPETVQGRRRFSPLVATAAAIVIIVVGIAGFIGAGTTPLGPATATKPPATGAATGSPEAAGVVPWVDRPAPAFVEPTPAPYPTDARPCRQQDLAVKVGPGGAGLGNYNMPVSFINQSSSQCILAGSPTIGGVTAAGKLVPLNASEGSYFGDPGPTANMGPDGVTMLNISGADACDAILAGAHRIYPVLRLGLPAGGSIDIPGGGFDTICGVSVSAFGVPADAPSAAGPPPSPLTASIGAPATAMPGVVLEFTVTLTNPTATDVVLAPCPAYTEFVGSGDTTWVATIRDYYLNCSTASTIPAGGALTFAMRLALPADQPAGMAKFGWDIRGGAGPWAGAPLEIRAVGSGNPPSPTASTAAAPRVVCDHPQPTSAGTDASGSPIPVTLTCENAVAAAEAVVGAAPGITYIEFDYLRWCPPGYYCVASGLNDGHVIFHVKGPGPGIVVDVAADKAGTVTASSPQPLPSPSP